MNSKRKFATAPRQKELGNWGAVLLPLSTQRHTFLHILSCYILTQIGEKENSMGNASVKVCRELCRKTLHNCFL